MRSTDPDINYFDDSDGINDDVTGSSTVMATTWLGDAASNSENV
jgi:hypothetical protein